MSLKPEEIKVGHVYRGNGIRGSKVRRRVTELFPLDPNRGVQLRYENVLVTGDTGLCGILARVENFARWAVADITQEEKSNG